MPTALDSLRSARKAVEKIYAPVQKLKDNPPGGGDPDTVSFCSLWDPGAREQVEEAITEIRALLTVHQSRRRGENERSVARMRKMMRALAGSELKAKSCYNAIRKAHKIVSERAESVMAEREKTLPAYRIIHNLRRISEELSMELDIQPEDEEGVCGACIAHTTSAEFCFVADLKIRPKDSEVSETAVIFVVDNEEKTSPEIDEDLSQTIRLNNFDRLKAKFRSYIANEKLLMRYKEHKLDSRREEVYNTLKRFTSSSGLPPPKRLFEGPSVQILPRAKRLSIDLHPQAATVREDHNLVFVGSSPLGSTEKFLYVFEIQPSVLITIQDARLLSNTQGVSHLSYKPLDTSNKSGYPSIIQVLRTAPSKEVTLNVMGQKQFWSDVSPEEDTKGVTCPKAVWASRVEVVSLDVLPGIIRFLKRQTQFIRLASSCFHANIPTPPSLKPTSGDQKPHSIKVSVKVDPRARYIELLPLNVRLSVLESGEVAVSSTGGVLMEQRWIVRSESVAAGVWFACESDRKKSRS